MITSIKVQGFKSLEDFKIEFTKGINVIVGPNGTGKTNICQSLILLSSATSGKIVEYINSFGGASSVFNNYDKQKNIKIQVVGNANVVLSYDKMENDEIYDLSYFYQVEIKLNKYKDVEVNEKAVISRKDKEVYEEILEVITKNKTLSYKILNKGLIGDFQIQQDRIKLRRQNLHDTMWGFMPRISFVCHVVCEDLRKIRSINIIPNIAKQACDIVEPNTMQSNGKYLANAIYSMQKNKNILEIINSLLEDSLKRKAQIKSEFSAVSLKRSFSLEFDNIKFPASCLSDGTIKLIGLLIGIWNNNNNTIIIEEPENYLHPAVDQLIIDHLREIYNEGVCVITTHSETILNMLAPNELILCEMKGNRTIAKRLSDSENISSVIENSGLGCGYFYVSGCLNDNGQ